MEWAIHLIQQLLLPLPPHHGGQSLPCTALLWWLVGLWSDCFSPIAAYITPSDSIQSQLVLKEGVQVSSSLTPASTKSGVCSAFYNMALPASYRRQPRAMTIAYTLGDFGESLGLPWQFKGRFPILGTGILLYK